MLIDETKIRERLTALGRQIEDDYRDKPLTIVAVLTGSLIALADLVRQIRIPFGLLSYRQVVIGERRRLQQHWLSMRRLHPTWSGAMCSSLMTYLIRGKLSAHWLIISRIAVPHPFGLRFYSARWVAKLYH